jgi:phenylacetate-CoA ligase
VRARGLDLRFERIASVAAVLSEDVRAACREVLGANPIDGYGAHEVGYLACECPVCGLYHINAEANLVEILHEDGSPCAPGETGRVVLTSLYNYAMPFIRYEIGDYATLGPARVKCPVRLPTLKRIIGRYRNTFTLRDGRIIYPYVTIGRFRDFISFDQVQVVQTDYDTIEVRYVPADGACAADEAGLEAYLREAIDPTFKVRAIAVSEIPRAASGKFDDFLSLVPRQ